MKKETFEDKLKLSREIVEKLMDPDITLEESVKLYEKGLATIRSAQKMIEEAKSTIEVIEKRHGGEE
jgi:exodeoxyribonuclease VII small subunit